MYLELDPGLLRLFRWGMWGPPESQQPLVDRLVETSRMRARHLDDSERVNTESPTRAHFQQGQRLAI